MEMNAFLSKQEQAPLNTCVDCKDRPCIKTGEICKDVEKLLKQVTTGRRNWLTYHSSDLLEDIAYKDEEGHTCNMRTKEKGIRAKRNQIED